MSRRTSVLLAMFTISALLLATCADSDNDSDAATSEGDTDSAETPAADDRPDATVAGSDDELADESSTDSDGDAFGFDAAAELESDADIAQEDSADPSTPTDSQPERLPAEVTALFVGRQIIKTGDVVVEAADVRATTDAIIDVVFDNGGAIWGQETQSEPTPSAVLTVRVPPLEFDQLMSEITGVPGVGVVSENTTSDDVTEVVVDLDARITAAQSSVARVQLLLDEARDLNTIFQLEEELASRQADLERLLGQRKTIGDQISLSTITVTILELDPDRLQPEMEVIAWLGDDKDDACPGASSLSVGADDTAVLCVNISNTGEDALTAIDVKSSSLRLRVDDFTVEDGVASLDEIQPGDELLLTVELDTEGGAINRVDVSAGLNLTIEVSATPATSESLELTNEDTVFISADVDDPLPGFADSFSSGWAAMVSVIGVLMIILGVLLPFVPIILLGLWLGRKILAKQRARVEERAAFVDAYRASEATAKDQDV